MIYTNAEIERRLGSMIADGKSIREAISIAYNGGCGVLLRIEPVAAITNSSVADARMLVLDEIKMHQGLESI